MKNCLWISFLLVLMVVGCSQEDVLRKGQTLSDGRIFTTSFENSKSRTYVEEGNLLRWTANDCISLFDGNSLNRQYKFDGETGDNGGTFSIVEKPYGTGVALNANYAVYPYNKSIKILETGVITATLPAEQYYAENSFGLGDNTMVAVTQDTDDTFLDFKNVCGYLKLQLYGDDITVESITLTGNNNEKIVGKVNIMPGYNGDPAVKMSEEATGVITLDCGEEGVRLGASAETATAFWFVLPPVIFSKGMTISVIDANGGVFTHATDKELRIERNVVKPMATVEVNPQQVIPYLTFTADAEQTLTMSKAVSTLEYSVDGGEWNSLGTSIVTFGGNNGSLRLRGKSGMGTATSANSGEYSNFLFGNETPVACSGDIRTLLDYVNYLTVSTKDARFCHLFRDCPCLTSSPELPATELASECYAFMFRNCTNLVFAPELPATVLTEKCYFFMFNGCTTLTEVPKLSARNLTTNCYGGMFGGCTSLREAPDLPATTLAKNCYYLMFMDCTNLVAAPELPVTTLEDYCYYGMFYRCTSLQKAPELPATALAESCYNIMFGGCTSLTEAPVLPATTLAPSCYFDMFSSCVNLIKAPILPAKTLVTSCYTDMFNKCSKLNAITMLATDISASKCLNGWVEGVASTGTFTKAAEMTSLPIGVSGIPEGWMVKNYGDTSNDIPNNQIWYTSSDGNIVTPYKTGVFGANIVSNVYEAGKGIITFDGDVTSIGDNAFDVCCTLTSAIIPNSVTAIGLDAFVDCSSLTSVTIPNSVTTLGAGAFYGCSSLTDITIPDGVTEIGASTFGNCRSLTSFTIPSGVTAIDGFSFYGCISLESITIPSNVTTIGYGAFPYCKMTSIIVEQGNPVYDSRENCNAIIETKTNTLIQGCQTSVIPNSVTSIRTNAFYGCFSLVNITIPNSVTAMGNNVFYGCNSLVRVDVEATTPPLISSNTFSGNSTEYYVPAESIMIYKVADYWKDLELYVAD